MHRPSFVKISRENARHNIRQLFQMVGQNEFFCPMVKANAYGHGDIEISKVITDEGVSSLGVALIEEGVRLRESGLDRVDILVFHPYLTTKDAEILRRHRLTPVLSSWSSLESLEKTFESESCGVHLKFNTGMSRLGFSLHEADQLSRYFRSNNRLKIEGLCTHLLSGEDRGIPNSRTDGQIESLHSAAKKFSGLNLKIHCLNSSAIVAQFCLQQKGLDNMGARPGLSLYGVKPEIMTSDPRARERWSEINFKPVMSVESSIVLTQFVPSGSTVSYGGTFQAQRDTLIGVIPVGYADGYSRHFSNIGAMLCCGRKVPVSGTVCMDFTMVNLTDLQKMREHWVGEPVVILGAQDEARIAADDLARMINTNSYEVLTNFSSRMPRVYL